VFVDGHVRRSIELAWQNFRPQDRQSLSEPVAFECVYYEDKGYETMRRLQSELMGALRLLEERMLRPGGTGSVTPIGNPDR
jgi:hypothetical protein